MLANLFSYTSAFADMTGTTTIIKKKSGWKRRVRRQESRKGERPLTELLLGVASGCVGQWREWTRLDSCHA